jgi:hypothetical protein
VVRLTLEVRLPQEIAEKLIFELIDADSILRDARGWVGLDSKVFSRN